ncbi:TPA: protein YpfM [Klebsiella pneumoniae]|nr:protein YpfM [Klebsiella pneumoniae]HBV5757407.1 protein YpfM [Klebsiella pneumoniae]HCI6080940.1 protein YpfM [Klebsiella pneumoniae]HDR2498978.1 protein YpfM [Enterobacter roggenkampii]
MGNWKDFIEGMLRK